MKTLLKILYVLLVLIILALLAGLFFPKKTYVEVEKDFRASRELVFDHLNDLTKWQGWIPWADQDNSLKLEYNAKTKGQGAGYSWSDPDRGAGSVIIIRSIPEEKVSVNVNYGATGTAEMHFNIISGEEGTKVKWIFQDTSLTYFERYFVTLLTNNMRNGMRGGLDKLETITNELRLSRVTEVVVTDLSTRPAMIISDSSGVDQVDSLYRSNLERLNSYLSRRNLEMAGSPFLLIHTSDTSGAIRFDTGIPIPKRTWGWGDYQYYELPEGKAIKVTHLGLFSSRKPIQYALDYAEANDLMPEDFYWEIYETGPEATTDTSQWKRQLYFPLVTAEESIE